MSAVQPWVDAFKTQGGARGVDAPWLTALRRQALARFADEGWPGLRAEHWRHTSLAPVADAAARWLQDGGLTQSDANAGALSADVLAQAQHLLQSIRPEDDAGHWLVFVDGVHAPQLSRIGSLPGDVRLASLSDALRVDPAALEPYYGDAAQGTPVMALNAAFAGQGAFVHAVQGAALAAPVHLVFLAVTPGRIRFLRNVIVLEPNASVTVMEHFVGLDAAAGMTHTATRAYVARDAQLTHAKLQQEGLQSFHLGSTVAVQESGARHQSHSLSLGARLARHDVESRFCGKHCHALLNGLYLLDGRRHVDHHTLIDHAHPDSVSQEYYRGILADQARGVFCGRILVAPGADRTDAEQRCDSLLLSRMARADTQPELEIYADDVKCAHGATVGQLDEGSLFYLRTRGLTQEDAHSVLVYAFAMQALRRIDPPELRTYASRAVRTRLPGGGTLGDIAWV